MDADAGSKHLSVDVKSQSRSVDWLTKHDEWRKVQADAVRANKDYGILVISNKLGENVAVIPMELLQILLDYMKDGR